MAPGGSGGKENRVRNTRSPSRPSSGHPPHPHRMLSAKPPARPPASPVRPSSSASAAQAAEVARYLAALHARLRSTPRARVVSDAGENLLRALAAIVNLRKPRLYAQAAELLASLTSETEAAGLLANKRYLAVLEGALAHDAGGDTPSSTHVQEAWRDAARAVRNLTAFSEGNAYIVARETQLVRLVVRRVEGSLATPLARHVVECAAALANLIRYGATYQSYVHKHGGMRALAGLARAPKNTQSLFHACRALAEFSLNPKWVMALLSENCVATSLKILEKVDDPDIAAEATRCVGNLAAARVGREAVLKQDGLERIVRRVLLLGTSVAGTLVRDFNFTKHNTHLAVDLFRAMSNMCVANKDAARRLINAGGVMALISACDEAQTGSRAVQKEAFRGMLIVAQAGLNFRATVLREIGMRIRHDTILGRSTDHLYDLGRRIKVEASTEQKDDIPQTIAGLGSDSGNYVLNAGPGGRRPRSNQVANSVPDLKSPAQQAFRRSGRILSVQRHVPHRERLERERRLRSAKSPGASPARHRHASGAHQSTSAVTSPTKSRPGSSAHAPGSVDVIPHATVVETQLSGSGNLLMQALTALASAMSGMSASTSSGPSSSSRSPGRTDSVVSADTFDTFDDRGQDVYEIGEVLGRGGFATVFIAQNLRTREMVAVKRFHPPLSTAPDAKKKAEQAARRAVKEQRIWDGLKHKNIVSYRGCFFGEKSELNLVAEYIPGWSLADHLSQIDKFPEHMVARIACQIVDGLDYLHKMGVTHRDVKPANILVHPSGQIKITDFGVSSAVDVPTMTGNALVGTPWYIAPEMIKGLAYGKSVDVWSLGCTIIELATGRRPYHNLKAQVAMFKIAEDRHPPIPSSVSRKLRDFLLTCWVKKPEERPTPAHLRRHPFLSNISDPMLSDLANKERSV